MCRCVPRAAATTRPARRPTAMHGMSRISAVSPMRKPSAMPSASGSAATAMPASVISTIATTRRRCSSRHGSLRAKRACSGWRCPRPRSSLHDGNEDARAAGQASIVMRISIIVSTYNQPSYLERVLWGYAVQTDRDFQLVVADDGSGPETGELIRNMRTATGLDVLHVWHEDRGFRKSEILNRAIVAAAGDYLLFTDGDSIPRRDLVHVHRTLARPGHYLAGSYIKLPQSVSDRIDIEAIVSGRFADLAWLRSHGLRPGRRALRLTRSRTLAALFDRLTPTRARFQGNNASTWRDALV